MHSPSDVVSEAKEAEEKPELRAQTQETFDQKAFEAKNSELQKNLQISVEELLRREKNHLPPKLDCDEPIVTINLSRKTVDDEELWTPSKIKNNPDMVFGFTLDAHMNDKDGKKVISFHTSFFYDKKSREWIGFRWEVRVGPKAQGNELGAKIAKAEEDACRKEGIAEMVLLAGYINGTYSNAKQGFEFAIPEVKTQANRRLRLLLNKENIRFVRSKGSDINLLPFNKELSAQEISQLEAIGDDGQKKEITVTRPVLDDKGERVEDSFTSEELPLGKAFLLDVGEEGTFKNGWEGYKRLL